MLGNIIGVKSFRSGRGLTVYNVSRMEKRTIPCATALANANIIFEKCLDQCWARLLVLNHLDHVEELTFSNCYSTDKGQFLPQLR